MSCAQCNEKFLIIADVCALVAELPVASQIDVGEVTEQISQLELTLAKFVGHLVADFAHSKRKQDILKSLGDNEALVVHDFMMKFLPQKYAETQSDHFGKAGMSLHGSTFILNFPTDYDFAKHGFKPLCNEASCEHTDRQCWVMPDDKLMVHCRMVMGDSKQDWKSTVSAIEQSSKLFSEKYPQTL